LQSIVIMHKPRLLIVIALAAILSANSASAQSPTNLIALRGLVPISTLENTAAGKASLAANLAVTASIRDGCAQQPLLLSFPQQQQLALRDAYITDDNAYELADGLGSSLGRIYWSLAAVKRPPASRACRPL
jgi:hypothetical protein